MTINLKTFSDKSKLSKMGEFQDLKPLDGLEVSSVSADLYNNGRDDLALFYFKEEQITLLSLHLIQLYQKLSLERKVK